MNKEDLVKKIKVHLENSNIYLSSSDNIIILEFINSLILFNSKISQEVFSNIFRVLQDSVIEKSINLNYIASKNAIFGEFKDVRTKGFYNRYLHNIKRVETYIDAYQLTEDEYIGIFGKKRYSSYDSFRIIKNRINKKE
tara:strand:+ start:286 stop:702 length:417 start_codon:yes stop_codon:yes gene_type:complete